MVVGGCKVRARRWARCTIRVFSKNVDFGPPHSPCCQRPTSEAVSLPVLAAAAHLQDPNGHGGNRSRQAVCPLPGPETHHVITKKGHLGQQSADCWLPIHGLQFHGAGSIISPLPTPSRWGCVPQLAPIRNAIAHLACCRQLVKPRYSFFSPSVSFGRFGGGRLPARPVQHTPRGWPRPVTHKHSGLNRMCEA